jgi:alpha-D-xyloside xylohydrolase
MARDNGWLVEGTAFINPFGVPVDFTHPEALAWWQGRVAAFVAGEGFDEEIEGAAPIDGFKLDYGEDILTGIEGARTRFDFADGEDERTMHHRYTDLYHVAFGQPLGDGAGFLIARSGTWEGQRFVTCIWPGDLDNGFQRRGEEGHAGGLPAAVIAGQSLSASGYPLFASDTGGYLHGRPTSEVLMRWAAYAWLLPVMQLGGAGRNHNPWDFTPYGDSVFDEQTLEVVRAFANEHMRWFPYLYSLVDRAHRTGRPITPPFGLAWPEEGQHPDDQFAVGDHVMAAPIVGPSAEREVWLPSGRWIDWWTGEPSQGPARLTVSVPYDRAPLWLGEGAIVPRLRPGVDTLAPTEREDVESWADEPGWLVTRVVPAPGARFTLHDGGHIAVETDWNRVFVTLVAGALYDRHQLAVWSDLTPSEVAVDGRQAARVERAEIGACEDCWSREGRWTTVVPAMAGDGTARVELTLSE